MDNDILPPAPPNSDAPNPLKLNGTELSTPKPTIPLIVPDSNSSPGSADQEKKLLDQTRDELEKLQKAIQADTGDGKTPHDDQVTPSEFKSFETEPVISSAPSGTASVPADAVSPQSPISEPTQPSISPSVAEVIGALRADGFDFPNTGDLEALRDYLINLPDDQKPTAARPMYYFLSDAGISDEEMHVMNNKDWAEHVQFWYEFVKAHPNQPLRKPKPEIPLEEIQQAEREVLDAEFKPVPQPEKSRITQIIERIRPPKAEVVRLGEIVVSYFPQTVLHELQTNAPALAQRMSEDEPFVAKMLANPRYYKDALAVVSHFNNLSSSRNPEIRQFATAYLSSSLDTLRTIADNTSLSPELRHPMRESTMSTAEVIIDRGDENFSQHALALLDSVYSDYLSLDQTEKTMNPGVYGGALVELIHRGTPDQRERALIHIRDGLAAAQVSGNKTTERQIVEAYFQYGRSHRLLGEVTEVIDNNLRPLFQSVGFDSSDYDRLVTAQEAAVRQRLLFDDMRPLRTMGELDIVRALDVRIPGASKILFEKRGLKVFNRFTIDRLESTYRNLDTAGPRALLAVAESDDGLIIFRKEALEKEIQTLEKAVGKGHVDIWEINKTRQIPDESEIPDKSLIGTIRSVAANNGPLVTGFIFGHGTPTGITYGESRDGRFDTEDLTLEVVDTIRKSFIPGTSIFFSSCQVANEGGFLSQVSLRIPEFPLLGGTGTGGNDNISPDDFPDKITKNKYGGYMYRLNRNQKRHVAAYKNGQRMSL